MSLPDQATEKKLSITSVPGIGRKAADNLKRAGYDTVGEVAGLLNSKLSLNTRLYVCARLNLLEKGGTPEMDCMSSSANGKDFDNSCRAFCKALGHKLQDVRNAITPGLSLQKHTLQLGDDSEVSVYVKRYGVRDKDRLESVVGFLYGQLVTDTEYSHIFRTSFVPIYDLFQIRNSYFITMECLTGDCAQFAKDYSRTEGKQEDYLENVYRCWKEVTHALVALHHHNRYFQDVKPANVGYHRLEDGSITFKLIDLDCIAEKTSGCTSVEYFDIYNIDLEAEELTGSPAEALDLWRAGLSCLEMVRASLLESEEDPNPVRRYLRKNLPETKDEFIIFQLSEEAASAGLASVTKHLAGLQKSLQTCLDDTLKRLTQHHPGLVGDGLSSLLQALLSENIQDRLQFCTPLQTNPRPDEPDGTG
jgi:serine/threonine protein kinase